MNIGCQQGVTKVLSNQEPDVHVSMLGPTLCLQKDAIAKFCLQNVAIVTNHNVESN